MGGLRDGLQAGKDDLVAAFWLGLVALAVWGVAAILSTKVGAWALYAAFIALGMGLVVVVALAVRRPSGRRRSTGRRQRE